MKKTKMETAKTYEIYMTLRDKTHAEVAAMTFQAAIADPNYGYRYEKTSENEYTILRRPKKD